MPARMRLRDSSMRKRPGRYQEDDFEPVNIDKPAFVHEDVLFNEELAAHCAFPSLPMNHPGLGPSEIWKEQAREAAAREAQERILIMTAERASEDSETSTSTISTASATPNRQTAPDERLILTVTRTPPSKKNNNKQNARQNTHAPAAAQIDRDGNTIMTTTVVTAPVGVNYTEGLLARLVRRPRSPARNNSGNRPSEELRITGENGVLWEAYNNLSLSTKGPVRTSSPETQRLASLTVSPEQRNGAHVKPKDMPRNCPDWTELSDKIKYLIIYELSKQGMSFIQAIRQLDLSFDEVSELIELVRLEEAKVQQLKQKLALHTRDLISSQEDINSWLDRFRDASPQLTLITDVISEAEVRRGRNFANFMGLNDVAANLTYYQGMRQTETYNIPLNHYREDGWRSLPPHFNVGCREELLAWLEAEREALKTRPRKQMSMGEMLVRMDPPPGTVNPRRVDPEIYKNDPVAWASRNPVPPEHLAKGLHPDNYRVALRDSRYLYLLGDEPHQQYIAGADGLRDPGPQALLQPSVPSALPSRRQLDSRTFMSYARNRATTVSTTVDGLTRNMHQQSINGNVPSSTTNNDLANSDLANNQVSGETAGVQPQTAEPPREEAPAKEARPRQPSPQRLAPEVEAMAQHYRAKYNNLLKAGPARGGRPRKNKTDAENLEHDGENALPPPPTSSTARKKKRQSTDFDEDDEYVEDNDSIDSSEQIHDSVIVASGRQQDTDNEWKPQKRIGDGVRKRLRSSSLTPATSPPRKKTALPATATPAPTSTPARLPLKSILKKTAARQSTTSTTSPLAQSSEDLATTTIKRGRGRPRKNPPPPLGLAGSQTLPSPERSSSAGSVAAGAVHNNQPPNKQPPSTLPLINPTLNKPWHQSPNPNQTNLVATSLRHPSNDPSLPVPRTGPSWLAAQTAQIALAQSAAQVITQAGAARPDVSSEVRVKIQAKQAKIQTQARPLPPPQPRAIPATGSTQSPSQPTMLSAPLSTLANQVRNGIRPDESIDAFLQRQKAFASNTANNAEPTVPPTSSTVNGNQLQQAEHPQKKAAKASLDVNKGWPGPAQVAAPTVAPTQGIAAPAANGAAGANGGTTGDPAALPYITSTFRKAS